MNAFETFVKGRPFGFITEADLPELIRLHRLCRCVVRCGACRFEAGAQDLAHLVKCIEAGGDYVRDISISPREIDAAASWRPERSCARCGGLGPNLTHDIFDLKKQYNDVLKPISDLTTNVDKVNTDVRLLTEQIKTVSSQVGKLDEFSQSNAKLVNEIAVNVKALSTKVGEQDKDLRDVATKMGKYGVFWTILWAVILIAITVTATLLVRKAFPDGQSQTPAASAPQGQQRKAP